MKNPVKLKRKEILFKNKYEKPPFVICFIERKTDKGVPPVASPKFLIPNNMIRTDGFVLFYQQYKREQFRFSFKVVEKIETYIELIEI